MMTSTSANLARSITWASSKQSYLIARLLADRDLADNCLRAYALSSFDCNLKCDCASPAAL